MLTIRKKAFVDHYLLTGNASESARKAGYSVKTANVQGSRLLTNKFIVEAIQVYKAQQDVLMEQRKKELSKDSFVDTALEKFRSVEEEGIKPRYLEIAGKALGYIGSGSDSRTPSITNNIQINAVITNQSPSELWDMARKLMESTWLNLILHLMMCHAPCWVLPVVTVSTRGIVIASDY